MGYPIGAAVSLLQKNWFIKVIDKADKGYH